MKAINDKTTYNPTGEAINFSFVKKFLDEITPSTDGLLDDVYDTEDVAHYCSQVQNEIANLIGYLESMSDDLGGMAFDFVEQEQKRRRNEKEK